MTDNVENITVELLRGIRSDIATLSERVGLVENSQNEALDILKTLNANGQAIAELCRLMNGRLNVVDGRLARLEEEAGFTKV
jgi:hypothetical protein